MTLAKAIAVMVVKELNEWFPCREGHEYAAAVLAGRVTVLVTKPAAGDPYGLGETIHSRSWTPAVDLTTDVTDLTHLMAREFIGDGGEWTDVDPNG